MGGPVTRIEAGIQTVLRLKSVWTRSVFDPDSNCFQAENSLKTVWKQFKTFWNQLCKSTQVKIVDLKTVTDLKTVMKTVTDWNQLWIRITANFGDQLSGFSLKTVMDWNQLCGSKTVICQLLNPDNCWFRGPVIRIGSNPDNYLTLHYL